LTPLRFLHVLTLGRTDSLGAVASPLKTDLAIPTAKYVFSLRNARIPKFGYSSKSSSATGQENLIFTTTDSPGLKSAEVVRILKKCWANLTGAP
jgi:hypothetical protein